MVIIAVTLASQTQYMHILHMQYIIIITMIIK